MAPKMKMVIQKGMVIFLVKTNELAVKNEKDDINGKKNKMVRIRP